MTFFKKRHFLLISACFIFLSGVHGGAWGTEIRTPPLTGKPGQTMDIPVIIDDIDNLAGLKLVIKYDPEILTYKRATKANAAESLMHIINDKKPGWLIIVMAGAKGIKGKDLPVITLTFDIRKGLEGNHTTEIAITESQLMNDQLKEIKCKISLNPITIAP